jgi:hypothetical protein
METVSRLHCIFARVLPIDTALDGDSALDPGMSSGYTLDFPTVYFRDFSSSIL